MGDVRARVPGGMGDGVGVTGRVGVSGDWVQGKVRVRVPGEWHRRGEG